MSSAVIAENYSAAKLKEYICFVEQLGSNIHFHENKWVCSNLRRSPAERSCMFTLYFDRIPALHRETVKSRHQPYTREKDIYRQVVCDGSHPIF